MQSEIDDLNLSTPLLGRREFLVTSIIAGFALAVQPIQAQTQIKTDEKGLIAGEVKIPVADGEIPAYRAMPDAKNKKFPVVLVVHEIFGVHEHIQDLCRRFAKKGYMAIAPALYARQGEVSTIANIQELNRSIFSKIPDVQSMSDLDATVEYARKSGSGNAKKLSITGFAGAAESSGCMRRITKMLMQAQRGTADLCQRRIHPKMKRSRRCRLMLPRI